MINDNSGPVCSDAWDLLQKLYCFHFRLLDNWQVLLNYDTQVIGQVVDVFLSSYKPYLRKEFFWQKKVWSRIVDILLSKNCSFQIADMEQSCRYPPCKELFRQWIDMEQNCRYILLPKNFRYILLAKNCSDNELIWSQSDIEQNCKNKVV